MSRRKLNFNRMTVSLSCSCLKPKLSDNPPKPRSSSTNPITKLAKEDDTKSDSHCSYSESPMPGTAVEMDSNDPYLDFRQSMLQMIIEKEVYLKDDLRELLNCFLQLNAPCHHGIIIKAFTEIWNGMFSVSTRPASPSVKRVRRKQV
ncbi:hypothetical protein QQ045_004420 [Rhodiola kirilowii]